MNQAFTFDSERVIGLQFHLEWTKAILAETLRNCGDDLTEGPYVQTPDEILRDEGSFSEINKVMDQIVERFIANRKSSRNVIATQS